jgi:recombination associated protein RdgC
VDRDCELKTPDDQKSTVRYSRHTLEIDEVGQHIAAGKLPTQLAMTWNERVSFTLSDMGQIKKIKLLDVVLDGVQDSGQDDDGFDTDAAIVTGELSALIPDLLEALGGEVQSETVDSRSPAAPAGKPAAEPSAA